MKLRKFEYKKLTSTNDKSIMLIKKGFKRGIVFADKQLKGKGRYGRRWISIKGNLTMSVFFSLQKKFSLKQITKFNYIIILNLLKKITKLKIYIKEPNDIYYKKKKFCGILQEIVNFKENTFIIVGIGINIIESPKIFKYKTTYLNKYLTKKINKYFLFKEIKKTYEKNLSIVK